MSIWATDNGIYCGLDVREQYFQLENSILCNEWKSTDSHHMYCGDGNVTSIGPNGSGKTRCLLVPNLFNLPNWSTLVVDPKGELAVWTAKHRKDTGSEIVTFDPFGVIERRYPSLINELPYLKNRGINPIAMLNPDSDDFVDDANLIGEALIQVDREESYWGDSARALVTGLVMALRIISEKDGISNSLAKLRELLGSPPQLLAHFIANILENLESEPAIAAKLNRFKELSSANRELFSILSTAVTQTNWLDSKSIQRGLSEGVFDFGEMKQRPITVFLILPPQFIETHASWLRLMVTAVLTPLIRTTAQRVPVLLMLDEFAAIGRLELIERNMPLMRGFGIKLWIILQDLSQLKHIYQSRWESFIANAGITHCFAPNDMTTRDYFAKMSGNRLYWIWGNSQSSSTTRMADWSSTSTQSNQNSRTFFQDFEYPQKELAKMRQGHAVLFEYRCAPCRILLPDPSQMFISNLLNQAEVLAARYELTGELKLSENK